MGTQGEGHVQALEETQPANVVDRGLSLQNREQTDSCCSGPLVCVVLCRHPGGPVHRPAFLPALSVLPLRPAPSSGAPCCPEPSPHPSQAFPPINICLSDPVWCLLPGGPTLTPPAGCTTRVLGRWRHWGRSAGQAAGSAGLLCRPQVGARPLSLVQTLQGWRVPATPQGQTPGSPGHGPARPSSRARAAMPEQEGPRRSRGAGVAAATEAIEHAGPSPADPGTETTTPPGAACLSLGWPCRCVSAGSCSPAPRPLPHGLLRAHLSTCTAVTWPARGPPAHLPT